MAEMKCSCGGTLRRAVVSVDARPVLGMRGTIKGEGLLCDKSGEASLTAKSIARAERVFVHALLTLDRRFFGEEARFMRLALGLTQAQLAKLMGVVRKTVVQWERKSDISIANDYMLRGLVMAKLDLATDIAELGIPRKNGPKKPRSLKLELASAA